MTEREQVLDIIKVASIIVCKHYNGGDIKYVVNDSCVEITVSQNYDECKKALFISYDSEVMLDGKFKTSVITNDNANTIKIHVEDIH